MMIDRGVRRDRFVSRGGAASRTEPVVMESLAQKIFCDVFGGFQSAADAASAAISRAGGPDEDPEAGPARADAVVSSFDERAQTGRNFRRLSHHV